MHTQSREKHNRKVPPGRDLAPVLQGGNPPAGLSKAGRQARGINPSKKKKADDQSGNFSCLMAPAGPWELAFLFWRRGLFFARKRDFFFGVFIAFLVVFFALLVVILRFLG